MLISLRALPAGDCCLYPAFLIFRGSQKRKVFQRREYRSRCPHSHSSRFPVSLEVSAIVRPVGLPSQCSYICWEIKTSLFPQKVEDVLHANSLKNLLQDIALSLHDIRERGEEWGTFVHGDKAAESLIYTHLCLCGCWERVSKTFWEEISKLRQGQPLT